MTRACVAVWRAVIFWHGSNLTHRGTLWIKVKFFFSLRTRFGVWNVTSDSATDKNDLFPTAEQLNPPLVCLLGVLRSFQKLQSFFLFTKPENFFSFFRQEKRGWIRTIWHLFNSFYYPLIWTFVALLYEAQPHISWWKKQFPCKSKLVVLLCFIKRKEITMSRDLPMMLYNSKSISLHVM